MRGYKGNADKNLFFLLIDSRRPLDNQGLFNRPLLIVCFLREKHELYTLPCIRLENWRRRKMGYCTLSDSVNLYFSTHSEISVRCSRFFHDKQ